jgi:dTDP-4-amino-4,6-dideoxygalactose transaminase
MTAIDRSPRRSRSAEQLAIDGGTPVRSADRSWPRWPQPAADARRLLDEVLASGRWAITSPGDSPLFERRFSAAFADYLDVRHCVPVDHGSSALVIGLESLGLQYGDVVLVPALTWVASASASFRAGLVPVLVDVAPDTGCIDIDSVDLDVDPRAVIAVHWAAAMADIPALTQALQSRDIPIIEDAAQAHGAQWQGRSAGTLGVVGCFSMQNGKVLTGGEGGAVVTDDDNLALVLQELRADSRRYPTPGEMSGGLDLVESASILGANRCMTEFSAAVLCAQLEILDRQHDIRNRNYQLLSELLSDVPDIHLISPRAAQNRMSIYEVPLILDSLQPGATSARVAEALTAELNVRFYQTREPLNRSRLLQPWTKPGLKPLADRFVALHRGREYPNADRLARHTVLTHHSTLLGGEDDMVDIAAAVTKVLRRLKDDASA